MTQGWPVHWRDTIDSTNEEAKRLAASAGFENQWIAAREQTAGRGRLDRRWESPVGNLYSTALFWEPGGIDNAIRVPFAAALATADAIGVFAPDADIRLKWPNDVRCGGAKLSGILIETGYANDASWVAAGIGINVRRTPGGAGQAASSIADLRGDDAVAPDIVLGELNERFVVRLYEARSDFPKTRQAWLDRAEGLGGPISVSAPEGSVRGVFETLEADCGLVLRLPDSSRRTIRAGDVSLIRETN